LSEQNNGYIEKALRYRTQGNFDEALKFLNFAIQSNPRDEQAYNQRGTLYVVMGLVDLAREDFKRVLQLRPDLKDHVDKWLTKLKARPDMPHLGEVAQMLIRFAYRECGPNRLGTERPTWQVYSETVFVFDDKGAKDISYPAVFDFCPSPQTLLTVDLLGKEYLLRFLIGVTVNFTQPPNEPFAELKSLTIPAKLDALQKTLDSFLAQGIFTKDNRFLRYGGVMPKLKVNPLWIIRY
jgi:tetratricopeptide (TPR) repeat protein